MPLSMLAAESAPAPPSGSADDDPQAAVIAPAKSMLGRGEKRCNAVSKTFVSAWFRADRL